MLCSPHFYLNMYFCRSSSRRWLYQQSRLCNGSRPLRCRCTPREQCFSCTRQCVRTYLNQITSNQKFLPGSERHPFKGRISQIYQQHDVTHLQQAFPALYWCLSDLILFKEVRNYRACIKVVVPELIVDQNSQSGVH